MNENNELLTYDSHSEGIKLKVQFKNDNIWLNRKQITKLFNRDIKTIGKHINNTLKEELEVITSVGYRVKSRQGILFRRWANQILKDYFLIVFR